jgi:hypothetical protein
LVAALTGIEAGRWAQIDITQVGRLEHNPLGWTTQAGDTHNRSQYDTREFKQTCKAVAGAGAGLKEASMETRRHAAFNHWNTELVGTPPPPHCTALSLIPTSNGNTVRNFPTHGQLSAAQGNLTSCLNFDFAILNLFDPSAL